VVSKDHAAIEGKRIGFNRPNLLSPWAQSLIRSPQRDPDPALARPVVDFAGDSQLERTGIWCSMSDSIRRLYDGVRAASEQDPGGSRTARLLQAGPRKIAKKVAEEAAEVALEAAVGNRNEVVRESADLLYHLVVLWFEAGVQPKDIWAEMDRREKMYGIAEKISKNALLETKGGAQPVPLDHARRRRAR
jgi:phosphoribosyl-ATP pyrophosphohydrolase